MKEKAMLREGAVWALGAVSAAPHSGVCAALLQSDGVRILAFGPYAQRAYRPDELEVLSAAQGCMAHEPAAQSAAELVETACASMAAQFEAAQLIGFRGQPLRVVPDPSGEGIAGSADVLAEILGRPVVSEFAEADIRLGGNGAPLEPFFHFACARWLGARAPLLLLDLERVARLSWVDPRAACAERFDACLAFDLCPAPGVLDDLPLAEGFAIGGRVNSDLVAQFLAHPHFFKIPPKQLAMSAFDPVLRALRGLGAQDGRATLRAGFLKALRQACGQLPAAVSQVLVTGSGRHDADLLRELAAGLGCPVVPIEAVGLNGDVFQAQAYAYLAIRVLRGLPTSGPVTTGVSAFVSGGQISQPGGTT
jgi:anhydro-N-acetylmuramic acid kinase